MVGHATLYHVISINILLHYVLDYIYSMNGVTQHGKTVTVGQPAVNTPVGKRSVNAVFLSLSVCNTDFLAERTELLLL